MRSQDERGAQPLDIAGALFLCALVVAIGAAGLWLGGNAVGDVDDRTVVVLVTAGTVAAAAHLARRRHT